MIAALKKQQHSKPGEGGESDFQSYQIIISKTSIFQQKITSHTKSQASMAHSRKKERDTIPEEAQH